MPDYLGTDQRKVKEGDKKKDEPVQTLDEDDIAILKTYVRMSTHS